MGSRGAHIGAICCLLKCISREMGGKRSWYGFWCYSGHCATTPTLLKTFGLFPDSGVYTVAINIRERVFAWVLCETVSSFLWMPRIVIAIVVTHLIFKGNCLSSGVSVSFCIFYQSCVMDPISPHPVKPLVLPWYRLLMLNIFLCVYLPIYLSSSMKCSLCFPWVAMRYQRIELMLVRDIIWWSTPLSSLSRFTSLLALTPPCTDWNVCWNSSVVPSGREDFF